jgi:transcriptional regulator with XRE-family HTH domain
VGCVLARQHASLAPAPTDAAPVLYRRNADANLLAERGMLRPAAVPASIALGTDGQSGRVAVGGMGFGERLRRYRSTAGLTQETLAERTGLSVRGIADLERGARRFPHVDTIRRLAVALELTPADRAALLAAGQRAGGAGELLPPSLPNRPCPRCERENPPAARFCIACGKPLELACPACGTPADPAARFCPSCGSPLRVPAVASTTVLTNETAPAGPTTQPTAPIVAAREGEYKLATVLSCQLAEAGPLAQRVGGEGMLAFLDYFFGQAEAEVRQFEGTISSFLSDGFVALFGVPVAHEDHGRRGVLAALGLQRRLKEPWSPPSASHAADPVQPTLRMSLATGLVAVGHVGSGPERRATAAGEPPCWRRPCSSRPSRARS